MSEDLFSDRRLTVSRYTGPETEDGKTRVRVQLSGDSGEVLSLSIDEWLALGSAFQVITWERQELPICYSSKCERARPPHGRWPDCPPRER